MPDTSLDGASILITGGTGSFGTAVLRRLLNAQVKEVRIFSRDEKKQDDLRQANIGSPIRYFIGDVRDPRSLRQPMEGADFVFHAAALKQVPSCEFHPMEAVRTNILGTENVLDAAIDAGVRKVVVLSTDKAAYPINAMGMTKALMEKVMVAKARSAARHRTVLTATRYGNVMGSRGSVIPLFLRQIQFGEALTVTDPNMTRFMMSIDEAVALVLYAWEHGEPGDTFVQKAPAATLETLANALIAIARSDVQIRNIGPRHGEKLYETLVTREERAKAIDLGEYFRIPADARELDYGAYEHVGQQGMSFDDEYHSHNAERLDRDSLIPLLMGVEQVADALRGAAGRPVSAGA